MPSLADLSVRITADMLPLQGALLRSEKIVRGFAVSSNAALEGIADMFARGAGSMGLMGVGIATAFAGVNAIVITSARDLAKIADVAQRTGASAKFLQELAYAIKQNGGEAEDASVGLQKFAINVAKAVEKGGDLAKIFAANGVALIDAGGKLRPIEELFKDYASLVQRAGSEQDQMNLAALAFGKSAGPALVQTLQGGAQGINDMAIAAQKAGVVMGDGLVDQAAKLDDQLDDLTSRIDGLKKKLSEFGIPPVSNSMQGLLDTLKEVQFIIEALRTGKNLGDALFPFFNNTPDGQLQAAQRKLRIGIGTEKPSKDEIDKFYDRTGAAPKSASTNGKETVIPEDTSPKNEYEREVRSIQEKTEALKIEAATLGMSAQAEAAYRAEQELLAAADKAKIRRSPELVASIKAISAEMGKQAGILSDRRQARQDTADDLQRRQRFDEARDDVGNVGATTRQVEAQRYARERLFDIERQEAELGPAWAAKRRAGVMAEAEAWGVLAEAHSKAGLQADLQDDREALPMSDRETVFSARITLDLEASI